MRQVIEGYEDCQHHHIGSRLLRFSQLALCQSLAGAVEDMEYLLKWFLSFLAVMGLCACTPSTSAAHLPYPDQNFAFSFEYGSCNRDILDTFNSTFTKDMIVDPAVTIPFKLSDLQTIEIYKKMVEVGFFEYPDNFSIPIPKNGTVGIVTPAMRYQITVRNGDLTKTLLWVDEIIDPTMSEAENLRSLFWLIINMIQNSEEYKQLPEPRAACV
jgi:hypothetical protein